MSPRIIRSGLTTTLITALWVWGFLAAPVSRPQDFALAAGPASQGTAGAPRDWGKSPAIVQVDTTAEVFAIGDVHGDYGKLVEVLRGGHLIAETPEKPERVRWNAGKAVLVCTGDLIDKGDHSLKVLQFFQALQADAARAGGRVIVTMGNHEAEFLARPGQDDKAAKFLEEIKAHGINPEEIGDGRDRLGVGAFLRSLPLAARVNDWFFAHAGNTQGRTLKDLDAVLRQGIEADGYGADILLDKRSLLEAKLHPLPWWEEAGEGPEASRARLAGYLQALGVHHLVIGHQPDKVEFSDGTKRHRGEIFQKFEGLIFLIDVGMSRGVDDHEGALLRIEGGAAPRATVLVPGKPPALLWP